MGQININLCCIALTLILISPLAFSQDNDWINTGGPYKGRPISLTSDQDGRIFVATSSGIYRSTDQGTTWTNLPSDVWIAHLPMRGIYNGNILSTPNGFLFMRTDDSLVFRSSNHGDSWNSLQSQLNDVKVKSFVSSTAGDLFALVDSMSILRSSDNGDHWSPMSFDVSFNHIYSFAVDSTRKMLINADTCIYVSTDNGNHWSYGSSDTKYYFYAISPNGTIFRARDEPRAYIFGPASLGLLCRSTDNGNNWTPLYSVDVGAEVEFWFTFDVNAFTISNAGDIYCIVLSSLDAIQSWTIYRSTDNGDSWSVIPRGGTYIEDQQPKAFCFDPEDNLYLGTYDYGVVRLARQDTICSFFGPSFKTLSVNEIATNSDGSIFAAVDSGLYRSMDNGQNWKNVLYPYLHSAPILAAKVNSQGTLFGLKSRFSAEGHLFRSTDDGEHWDSLGYRGHVFGISPSGVLFQGSPYGGGTINRSTDDGSNWTQVSLTDTTGYIVSPICFAFNSQNQVFAGDYSHFYIYRSIDSGNTWIQFHEGLPWYGQDGSNYHGLNGAVYNMAVHPSGIIFAASDSGFYRSTDNGEVWSRTDQGLPYSPLYWVSSGLDPFLIYGLPVITSIAFNPMGHVYVGYNRGVYYSTDLGSTWNPFISDASKNIAIKSIAFDTQGYLYGGSFSGTIYRSLSPVTSVNEQESAIPKKWILEQNFPNPFNPTTNIRFSLPQKGFVSLKIYDLLGREVAVIVSEQLFAGIHTYEWNAVHKASGVYFYRLHAGTFTETKKLILLK